MYTAYVLSTEAQEKLLKRFPPKYEKVIAEHITAKFGVYKDEPLPPYADIKVVGYADSGDGIEAAVVSVDGNTQREDKKYFHITLSLDPEKYKPVDSNELIGYGQYTLILPIEIETSPWMKF